MRSASSITERMPRSSMSRMVNTSTPARRMFSFVGIHVANTNEHAILRPHLGRKVVNVSQFRRPQAHDRGQRHAVHVAAGRGFGGIHVAVRVDPEQPDFVVLAPVKLSYARYRTGGH